MGYFTYSYSPIIDDGGDVGGVLLVSQDTTARVLAEGRLDVLRDLAVRSMDARTQHEACQLAAQALEGRPDFAFALVYLVESDGTDAVCIAAAGAAGLEPSQQRVRLNESRAEPGRLFQQLAGHRPHGVLADASHFVARASEDVAVPRHAFVASVTGSWTEAVAGFLVTGVSEERAFDPAHRSFLETVAFGIGRSVAAARAREAERDQVRSIAALDHAKTAVFSNTSHELRSPLALILGPLDELLDDPNLLESMRDPLTVARRGAARMLRLVSSMLDFSRIEAGKQTGEFQETDLAELTRDIAAMFRSTAERAGLRLSVDCPDLAARAFVDRDAWEQIISNLLSNALKFTPEGEIDVHLREEGAKLVLTVEDTGIGIPDQDLGEVFSRFYRGSDSRARTHEGSGIGLALVRELVRLHGGTVAAQRRGGDGTCMVVSIPAGHEHLSNVVIEGRNGSAAGGTAALFVEEAAGWVSDYAHHSLEADAQATTDSRHPRPLVASESDGVDRVLIVEDNGDMRDYLRRLLRPYFAVAVAQNGSDALKMVISDPPSILITDAMMPGLDGLKLVRAIREESRTRALPVLLISARADPETRLEAIDSGADDYLVKPFSARELLVRLRATLESSRLRSLDAEARGRESERAAKESELRALLDDLRAAQRRVAAAADAERRRIERNLHDGAQQRLMAIRLELGLLGERLDEDPAAAREEVDRLHAELNEALDELRELAHGLYPPLLASDGLYAALSAAAMHAAIPVAVDGPVVGRVPRAIESAAYFACLEALQNAAKHAGEEARATVRLDVREDVLAFSVTDDGVGFDAGMTPRGQGLINLNDRVGALGGSAHIISSPGRGTVVLGRIPLP